MGWAEKRGPGNFRARFLKPDGRLGCKSGFHSRTAALDYAAEQEAASSGEAGCCDLSPVTTHSSDPHRPRGSGGRGGGGRVGGGRVGGEVFTLAEWAPAWLDSLDVAIRTEEGYRTRLRNHILPRWGDRRLDEITNNSVRVWAKKLRAAGYAPVTVSGLTKQLRLMLSDAVDEQLLAANPVQLRRRGRREHVAVVERVWATPEQAMRFAVNAVALDGPAAGAVVLTAAWSGMRWGELAGLQTKNLHLDESGSGRIVIDPKVGSLHETDSGKLLLGPPKTAKSARTISLPAPLVAVLRLQVKSCRGGFVFTGRDGGLLRRSNFSRRVTRPAADGTLHLKQPRVQVAGACPGLTMHGLRHGHKTWMIADGIPEVAQGLRLGHEQADQILEVYSHVEASVERKLLACLETRWVSAIAALEPEAGIPHAWRDAA